MGARSPCRHRWVQLACPQTCFTCDPQYPPRHRVKLVSAPRTCGASQFCVLLATAVSSRDAHVAKVVEAMTATCRLGFARGVLNLFDADPLAVRADATLIRTTTVRGFRAELTPKAVAAFTHVDLPSRRQDAARADEYDRSPHHAARALRKRQRIAQGDVATRRQSPGLVRAESLKGDAARPAAWLLRRGSQGTYLYGGCVAGCRFALAQISFATCRAPEEVDLFWCMVATCDCTTCAKLNETYALERLVVVRVSYATPIFHRDEDAQPTQPHVSGYAPAPAASRSTRCLGRCCPARCAPSLAGTRKGSWDCRIAQDQP